MATTTLPDQTQSCMWNEPKANTVKNSELTRVHEYYILPGQHTGILSPFCFGSFVIQASALHEKVFIGHEIKFTRKTNLTQINTLNFSDSTGVCAVYFVRFNTIQYLARPEVSNNTSIFSARGKVQSHIKRARK